MSDEILTWRRGDRVAVNVGGAFQTGTVSEDSLYEFAWIELDEGPPRLLAVSSRIVRQFTVKADEGA